MRPTHGLRLGFDNGLQKDAFGGEASILSDKVANEIFRIFMNTSACLINYPREKHWLLTAGFLTQESSAECWIPVGHILEVSSSAMKDHNR